METKIDTKWRQNGNKIDTQLRQSGGKFIMKWETRFMLNGGAVG